MTGTEEQKQDPASVAAAWWRALQPTLLNGEPNPRGDRAALARLRRVSVECAPFEEAVLDLYRKLAPPTDRFDKKRLDRAIRLALILAHVRKDDFGLLFGQSIGRTKFADKDFETARLKPLRFQRLLNARGTEDIVREFRRAVDIAGNQANIFDLARLILGWDFDKTRTRFAFDYFAAGSSAPSAAADDAA